MFKQTMVKYLVAALALVILTPQVHGQLGKIHGNIIQGDEPVEGATVTLKQGSSIVTGAISSQEGKYEIAKVESGIYQLEVKYAGKTTIFEGVKLGPGETLPSDLDITRSTEVEGLVFRESIRKIFTVDPIDPYHVPGIELRQTAGPRDYINVLYGSGDLYQADEGDPINISGGRSGGTVTFVDGVKLIGVAAVPPPVIKDVTLLSSGIPAEYGDLLSGAIIINTVNPGMKGWTGKPMSRVEKREMRARRKGKSKRSGLPSMENLMAFKH